MFRTDTVSHLINVKSFQYSEYAKAKNHHVASFKPNKFVKLTLKVGANKATLNRMQSVVMEDFADGADMTEVISDVESMDFSTIIGYDFRIKIYANKQLSFTVRHQTIGSASIPSMFGMCYKFKYRMI